MGEAQLPMPPSDSAHHCSCYCGCYCIPALLRSLAPQHATLVSTADLARTHRNHPVITITARVQKHAPTLRVQGERPRRGHDGHFAHGLAKELPALKGVQLL
jgi:hypothetical protein